VLFWINRVCHCCGWFIFGTHCYCVFSVSVRRLGHKNNVYVYIARQYLFKMFILYYTSDVRCVYYVYLGVPMKFIRKFSTTQCRRAMYITTNLGVKCMSSRYIVCVSRVCTSVCHRVYLFKGNESSYYIILYCSSRLQYI